MQKDYVIFKYNIRKVLQHSLYSDSNISVICVEIKYVFLNTKSTIVIVASNSINFGSLITKSILIVFHLTSNIGNIL